MISHSIFIFLTQGYEKNVVIVLRNDVEGFWNYFL
jgi:hypothetical protein